MRACHSTLDSPDMRLSTIPQENFQMIALEYPSPKSSLHLQTSKHALLLDNQETGDDLFQTHLDTNIPP